MFRNVALQILCSAKKKKSTRGKNPFVLIKDKVKWDIRGKYNTNR